MSFLFSKFFFAVLVISFGSGFQHGYHGAIVNVTAGILKDWIRTLKKNRKKGRAPSEHEVDTVWASTMALFSVGGLLGSLLTGYFCDRFGRRKSLFYNNFIIFTAAALMVWSQRTESYEMFTFGKFISGINAGLNQGICQIYLVEIARDRTRGAVAGCYALMVSVGVLMSQTIGFTLHAEDYWPQIFLVGLIPACMQVICVILCPESPKHLVIGEDDEREAKKALRWLRGTRRVTDEMREIIEEDNLVKEMHAVTLKRLFTDPTLKTPLFVCLILNVSQELCGINSVFYYSIETLKSVGIDKNLANYAAAAIGACNFLATLLGLLLVDSVGRRILLLVSYVGMAINTAALFITFAIASSEDGALYLKIFAIAFMIIYTVMYSVGVGVVATFITAEIFNHSTRAVAVSLALSGNWICNLLVGQAFLPLGKAMSYFVYTVFPLLNLFFFFFAKIHVPETAQLSAKELMELYDYLL